MQTYQAYIHNDYKMYFIDVEAEDLNEAIIKVEEQAQADLDEYEDEENEDGFDIIFIEVEEQAQADLDEYEDEENECGFDIIFIGVEGTDKYFTVNVLSSK